MEEEKKKKVKLSNVFYYLKKTYQYAKQDKKYLFFFLIGSILLSVINVVAPLLSARQILYLTNEFWTQLFAVTLLIFGTEIFRNVCIHINNYFINKYFYSVKKNIQLDVSSKILQIQTGVLQANSSGTFIERAGNDTDTLSDIFIQGIDYLTYLISVIGVLFSILFLNTAIFFLYLLFVVLLFFAQKLAAKKIQEKNKIRKKKRDIASGFISELVRGAKDIKLLNAEKSFLNKTDQVIQELGEANYSWARTRSWFRFLNGDLRDLLDLGILLLGIYFITHKELEVATMLIILSYRGHIISISSNLEHFYDIIKQFELAAERIFEILEGEKYPKEVFGNKHISKIEGNIAFKNVFFGYEEDDMVLKNISFQIHPNETVSFVGKSGSGKSTIFNLISALYKPNAGEVTFDGIPLNQLDKASIRKNMSVISQNPYIFNMSIRENLTIIKEDLTEEEMIDACKMACLHDFIMTLKDGYDTIVGEGGVTLSGGQRQRLAIARALILKTEIILFDEATSALDNETQYEIQKSIQNMQGEYTILIIAHRLSTVINSDRLILIDNGSVAGEGTHQELLKNNPIYQKLYELELKDDEKKYHRLVSLHKVFYTLK